MDVDDDTGLMAQLRGLCTSDREAMVREFIQVVGEDRVNMEEAKFYLEMHSWTLANAIGAFYDNNPIQQQAIQLPLHPEYVEKGSLSMAVIGEITAGESVPPNTLFTKRFMIKNDGPREWPLGCEIRFVDGNVMQQQDSYDIPCLPTGRDLEISIPMISPLEDGSYQSQWKLFTPFEWSFGDSLFCIVTVDSTIKDYVPTIEQHQMPYTPYDELFDDPSNTWAMSLVSNDAASEAPGRPTTPNNEQEDMME